MSVITSLNVEEFSQRRTQVKYPNVTLLDVNPTTPLIRTLVEEGDVPIHGKHNGKTVVVGRMSNSAYNIDKLLRTHGTLIYSVSEEETYEINDIKDYLEVFKWT